MSKIRWDIDPARTALVVVDMQNVFLLPDAPVAAKGGLDLIPRFNRIIAEARRLRMPIVFTATTHDPAEPYNRMDDLFPGRRARGGMERGTHAQQLHPEVDFREGDILVEKPRYSAFFRTHLDRILRDRGIDTIVIGGAWSNVCVESTARDAFLREYKVVYLADCSGTGDLPDVGHGRISAEEAQRVTLADMAWHVGEVTTSEDVMERLRRK